MARTVVLSVLTFACSSTGITGARYHEGFPQDALAVYVAPRCTMVPSGAPLEGKPYVYFLVRGATQPTLLAVDLEESGLAIENTWVDERGRHFAYHMEDSLAYEIILPDDQSKPGLYLDYLDFRVIPRPGGFRLQGTLFGQCTMGPVTNTRFAQALLRRR
jgi:hypothetical protein